MRTLFCGCVLLLLPFAAFCGTAEPRVLRMAPEPRHVDVEAGVFFLDTNWMLYAHDLESGRLLWSRPKDPDRRCLAFDFRSGDILFSVKNGFTGLDKRTGRELWRQSERDLGTPWTIQYLGDDGWIAAVYYNKAIVLYSPDGRRYQTSIPFGAEERVEIIGWMPEEDVLVLQQTAKKSGFPNRISIFLWDLEREPYKAYDIDGMDRIMIYGILPSGEMALSEEVSLRDGRMLTFRDAETGTMLRSREQPGKYCSYIEGQFVLGDYGEDSFQLMDVETCEPGFRLEAAGQHFVPFTYTVSSGTAWVLSHDDSNNIWLWSVDNSAPPRMILDRHSETFLPGYIMALKPPYVFLFTKFGQMTAFRLEDMQQVAQWTSELRPHHSFSRDVSADLKRALASRQVDGKDDAAIAEVFEAGNPEPIAAIDGYPNSLSPDGRYFVVQTAHNTGAASIVETDSGKVCATLPKDAQYCSQITFSPDSRHVAVCLDNSLTIVTLEEGFPQKTVRLAKECYQSKYLRFTFSPDMSMFMPQSFCGEAVLYDTETGAELHRFAEPERFAEYYRDPGDSNESIWQRTRRFAGDIVKDVWNRKAQVPSLQVHFAQDGRQAITVARAQILRVWDVESGEEVRTIRTGLPLYYGEDGYIRNSLILSENGAYAFAFNADGYGDATLWDVNTGARIASYEMPKANIRWNTAVADDGSVAYMQLNDDLYFFPGRAKEE